MIKIWLLFHLPNQVMLITISGLNANLIIWTSDILGDLVMHGAVLGWSSGQNTVFMTYLIRK